jgi:hypothetical protein
MKTTLLTYLNCFALTLFLAAYGCGSDPAPALKPSNLIYATNTITVTQGTAAISVTPTVTGTAPLTFSIATVSTPNSAITINSSTGVVSLATTSVVGTFQVNIQVSNTAGNEIFTNALTITVNSPAPAPPSNLLYNPNAIEKTTTQTAASATPSIQGTIPMTYEITDITPANDKITINANTGVINLAANSTTGSFKVSVKATNSVGNQTFADAYTIAVRAPVTFNGAGGVLALVAAKCGPCHVAGGTQANWTNYITAKNNINGIISRTENGTMPPVGSPDVTTAEINLLKQWRDDGTPEN